jgi:hypothetical protein
MQQTDEEKFWKGCERVTVANQYYLEQLLGCGAYGGVFRAVQIVCKYQQKRVAIAKVGCLVFGCDDRGNVDGAFSLYS